MKRLAVSITLLICFVAAALASNGSAGKGIKWELKKGVLTISGTGPTKDFGKDRPWMPTNVEKLVVEEGITNIGDNLCRDCKNLKEVILPNTLETIGDNAFQSCGKLSYISLPSSLKSIGNSAFQSCGNLTYISLPSSLKSIGSSAFQSCGNLTYISLPSSLKSIGKSVFQSCENLSDIHIPYGVEEISDRAFYNCTALIELDLPISLKRIGNEAFSKCSSLVTARLAQGLELVGDKAFEDCRILANLSGLPDFIDTNSYLKYGLNRAAVKNYWDRKAEMAKKYGNASGTNVTNKNEYAKVEPSDVDTDIPYTTKENKNTFALIIANENYGKLANVPFAINDGEAFANYCSRTLGIPEKNILMYKDASYGSMREAFGDLRLINDFAGDNMKVIVYYAGHGAPDDATLDPYLIPVDAGRINKDVCLPLASIYQELGNMKLESAIVFLDACFSGGTREDKMVMADARAIARVPKKQGLTGKVAVLSATSDEQTALPYHEKGHGMFTYYLLKRLQETKGNVTLLELKDYITKEVSLNSSIINRKKQTPTFTVSNGASAEWDTWKLNE